jgi:hypothetical protein
MRFGRADSCFSLSTCSFGSYYPASTNSVYPNKKPLSGKVTSMKTIRKYVSLLCILSIVPCWIQPALGAEGGSGGSVPVVLQKGFDLLKTAGPAVALGTWREGGGLDEDMNGKDETSAFKEMVKRLRNYRSYEVIEIKEIGSTSKILYVSMSFERGVLYGSFLVWKSDRDWVVQQMDFNTKPQVIMPWLNAGGDK